MQSNNPILTRVETYSDFQQPMTVAGAVQKSVGLTLVAAITGLALFFIALLPPMQEWLMLQCWLVQLVA